MEAAKAEAARLDAERREADRAAVARQEAQRQDEERQAAAARREAALQAIGRQLNEEAARREAAAAARPLPSASTARRGRLFGRSDPNAELVRYAETWARKIESNLTYDKVRELARQTHTSPMVTVAIRSDGSVESVVFVQSSGVPAIDAAVARIVQEQAIYPPFPPALAQEFDVVEIRRTWHFDVSVRLY